MKTKVNPIYKHGVKILNENSSKSNQLYFNKIFKNPIKIVANQFHQDQVFILRMQWCFNSKNISMQFTIL